MFVFSSAILLAITSSPGRIYKNKVIEAIGRYSRGIRSVTESSRVTEKNVRRELPAHHGKIIRIAYPAGFVPGWHCVFLFVSGCPRAVLIPVN